jgi:hypothetical protein
MVHLNNCKADGELNLASWGNLPWVLWVTNYSPKLPDTVGSYQEQTAGEPYTMYQETTPPRQAKEMGPPT